MVGNVFIIAFLNEFGGTALPGNDHISWVPSEFIIPQIIIAFWSYQSAGKRFKQDHFSAFRPYFVDHFHGAHMVNTGGNANFIHKNQTFFYCCRIMILPFFTYLSTAALF